MGGRVNGGGGYLEKITSINDFLPYQKNIRMHIYDK